MPKRSAGATTTRPAPRSSAVISPPSPVLSSAVSRSFTLGELLRSATAERQPELKAQQENPPSGVIESLRYLAATALQPIRDRIGSPIHISSGYRCPEVNRLVGGSPKSQHQMGEAADCELLPGFLTEDRSAAIREGIRNAVLQIAGKPIRPDVNQNFYLFAYVCLHLDEFDVDQVIHEYGDGFARPAWVHVAASRGQNNRQILLVGKYTENKYQTRTVAEALAVGT